jgi:hypothetical protein
MVPVMGEARWRNSAACRTWSAMLKFDIVAVGRFPVTISNRLCATLFALVERATAITSRFPARASRDGRRHRNAWCTRT